MTVKLHTMAVLLHLFFLQASFSQPILDFELFSSTYSNPVEISNCGDSRLFIAEQQGRIMICDSLGDKLPIPFLDITDRVGSLEPEQGLLGLVFDPDYLSSGIFYVNYTDNAGDTRISRFQADPSDVNLADPFSEEILLTVDQPFGNHNGGDINFGPDGFLYIALGDGGSAGDPGNRAQNTMNLLGKVLRIDVSGGSGYTIPADNPFAADPLTLNEIWAFGLRNPWRFSFDELSGDLWIADVGQNSREEVNFQEAVSTGAENYGWRCYEANSSYILSGCEASLFYDFPLFEYPHDLSNGGFSVTGGFVYRGESYSDLYGHYVFADFISGNFWTLSFDDESGEWLETFHPSLALNVSSFGLDKHNEIYFARLDNGNIYHLTEICSDIPIPLISYSGDSLFSSEGSFYQWYLNDEVIPGAIAPFYIPQEAGIYTVEVTFSNNCVKISPAFNTVYSQESNSSMSTLLLSPIPASDHLMIRFGEFIKDQVLLKFTDLAGHNVLDPVEVNLSEQDHIRVDLKFLENGIYIVTAGINGYSRSEKFVINR